MMKNTLKTLSRFAVCLMMIGAVACSDDEPGGGGPGGGEGGGGEGEGGGPSTPELTEGISAEGYYKGDTYEKGTGNYWINFVSEDMEYDSEEDTYYGPGFILCVDFNSVLASNPDLAVPQSGPYTIGESTDYPAFSINSDSYDTYLNRYDANGNMTETSFTAGTMDIAYENGIYTIECKMTTVDEEEYEFTYVGPIPFYNRTGEGEMSNLTDNVEISGLTQGMALYEPEAFTTTSDLYIVILAGEDYDLETNFGQADALQISFNVTPGSNDGIPTGTYTIVDMNEVDDLEPETAIAGLYDFGGYYGTWYYSTGKHIESAMKEGTVEIENEGLDFYTIDATFKDGYGHQVKASYSGKLQLATVEYDRLCPVTGIVNRTLGIRAARNFPDSLFFLAFSRRKLRGADTVLTPLGVTARMRGMAEVRTLFPRPCGKIGFDAGRSESCRCGRESPGSGQSSRRPLWYRRSSSPCS